MVLVRWMLQLLTSMNQGLYSFTATNTTRLQRKGQCYFKRKKKNVAGNSFNLFTHLSQCQLLRRLRGGFPGGPVANTLCSQRRGPGFDPWLGNIPHAAIKTQHNQINIKNKRRRRRLRGRNVKRYSSWNLGISDASLTSTQVSYVFGEASGK